MMTNNELSNQSDTPSDGSKKSPNTETQGDNAQTTLFVQEESSTREENHISTNETANTENIPKKRGRKRKLIDGKER
jgi:hypothetical protein